MLQIKPGVKLNGLKPEILVGLQIVYACYDELGLVCTITSATDGKHGMKSLHYKGMALDFRTRHLDNEQKVTLKNLIREALGPEFDIVMHSTHLHVEFDPKE